MSEKMNLFRGWIIGYLTALFIALLKDTFALKDVVLTIEPKIVERGHEATLICTYDLQGANLYYVGWYRGRHQFYKYTPKESPVTNVFPIAGISIDVHKSNSTQVVLQDVDFGLSGNFSCEVSVEEKFSTAHDVKAMTVVQLPADIPKISVGSDPLNSGDRLRANCSSPPAKPPAVLTFFLNNELLTSSRSQLQPKSQEPSWSDLSVDVILNDFHFKNDKLILECRAEIVDIYYKSVNLELESARNPVPARVIGRSNCFNQGISLVMYMFIIVFSVS